jgi:hypothetical protein
LLSAFIDAGLPCNEYGFGGRYYKSAFLLDEHDRLSEWVLG